MKVTKGLFEPQKKVFIVAAVFLSVFAFILLLVGTKKDAKYYHDARESRMGLIEKIRRGHGKDRSAEICQHREGVERTVLRGAQQKLAFTITSLTADLKIQVKKETLSFEEEFHQAKGVFQEELYYLLAQQNDKKVGKEDHTKKVICRDGAYYGEDGKKKELTEMQIANLIPYQRIRTFIAQKVMWDFGADLIQAYACDFATYALPGHIVPDDIFEKDPDSLGYADKLHIQLNLDGSERVSAEGLQMNTRLGALPW